jgi:A/G-specific adenine glycosylase
VGSAGVSGRQAPFEGSRRQARGRVLQALLDGPQPAVRFEAEVVDSLVVDGLVVDRDGVLSLP